MPYNPETTIWLPPMPEPMTVREATVAFWLAMYDSWGEHIDDVLSAFTNYNDLREVMGDDFLPLANVDCRDSTALAAMALFDEGVKCMITQQLEANHGI